MADWTKCMQGPNMIAAMQEMEWMERATRREYSGCQSCKHSVMIFGDTRYCELEQKPFKGRLFCGRWAE